MNPIQIIKTFMSKGGNPKQAVMQAVSKNQPNPMINNLIQMANNGDIQGIEVFARNLFKEKGRDFDKEYENFMQNMRG